MRWWPRRPTRRWASARVPRPRRSAEPRLRAADAVIESLRIALPSTTPSTAGAGLSLVALAALAGGQRAGSARKAKARRKVAGPGGQRRQHHRGRDGKDTGDHRTAARVSRRSAPGLLTRGHGRRYARMSWCSTEHDQPPVSRTGDEAQLCMRATGVPDRHRRGSLGRPECSCSNAAHPRVLFLDDGFQHLQLHRDFDLVLIDALHPFGGGDLLPLGRLREPLRVLARAAHFVITRADEAPNTKAIEAALRRYNATAPIFCARTVAVQMDARRMERNSIVDPFAELAEDMRAIAFCGLGNPQAFWRTLRQVGIDPAALLRLRRSPSIHAHRDPAAGTPCQRHRRRGAAHDRERRGQSRARNIQAIIGSLKLYWLEVRTEIENGQKLVALIRQSLLLKECRG